MDIDFTRNTLKKNFRFVVKVPNGKLQREILTNENKVGSNCGLYGLNYEVHCIDGIAFIRGGRPANFVKISDDILDRYTYLEKHFEDEPFQSWETRCIECAKLRQQFAIDVYAWWQTLGE